MNFSEAIFASVLAVVIGCSLAYRIYLDDKSQERKHLEHMAGVKDCPVQPTAAPQPRGTFSLSIGDKPQ